MARPSVVVVGSSNTDLVIRAPTIPAPGETLLGGDLAVVPGGKGANQAVAAARLGAEVTFVACIGADSFGDASMNRFVDEGIDVSHVRRDASRPSGAALIVVAEGGENAIVVAPGSNDSLTVRDIDDAAESIRAADVLLVQLETPVEVVAHALAVAREARVTTMLDPAPARPLAASLLANVDWLTPNETEASSLAGCTVEDAEGATSAARDLIYIGVGNVVVTLGGAGALMVSRGETIHVPAPEVDVADTVAAGDAFNGALAVALGRGENGADAMRYACAVGALSVSKQGAQPSLPTADEAERFVQTTR